CVSDPAAFGALSECQRRGVQVPEDIAIAGFGAYEISEVCVPPLTTIDPQSYEIGRETARMILRILNGEEQAAVKSHVEIATSLVVRQSTGG
ncbi:MAG: substrate-binding domain-containing protein, partial [Pseudomonadota bacterium]